MFFVLIEIAVSLGKNDVRIYEKSAGKWKLVHTINEHLSRVLAIDWAPNTNRIVSASAVRFLFIQISIDNLLSLFQDYNAYVWVSEDKKTWKPQMVELQRTSRAVGCAKWSPQGTN